MGEQNLSSAKLCLRLHGVKQCLMESDAQTLPKHRDSKFPE